MDEYTGCDSLSTSLSNVGQEAVELCENVESKMRPYEPDLSSESVMSRCSPSSKRDHAAFAEGEILILAGPTKGLDKIIGQNFVEEADPSARPRTRLTIRRRRSTALPS